MVGPPDAPAGGALTASVTLTTRAPAKVNLTLAVLGRRSDGYHELCSLVAFAGAGDELSLTSTDQTGLSVSGPFGSGLAADRDNLVLRAAHALAARVPDLRTGRFQLVKRLPIASGIGGGSADAAAALRLLARINRLRLDDPRVLAAALDTGADVPVCLASKARMMGGAGEHLGEPLVLPRLFAVLANPLEPTPTAAVFGALGLARGTDGPSRQNAWPEPIDASDRAGFTEAILKRHGNDLQAPALTVTPAIADVLAALDAQPGCRLARMSGSGATCFGLFDDCRASAAAARAIGRAHPRWWVKATVIR
jgi:4-diphosphocytidyl-2-C-methyl-D-erythritol kinase